MKDDLNLFGACGDFLSLPAVTELLLDDWSAIGDLPKTETVVLPKATLDSTDKSAGKVVEQEATGH